MEILMASIQTMTKAPIENLHHREDKRKAVIKMLLILL